MDKYKAKTIAALLCSVIYTFDSLNAAATTAEGPVDVPPAVTSLAKVAASANTTDEADIVLLYPHNVTLERAYYNYLQISWEAPESTDDTVLQYIVYYSSGRSSECPPPDSLSEEVEADVFQCSVRKLEPGTTYSVCVAANMTSGAVLNSQVVLFNTTGFGGPANPCLCSSSLSTGTCNMTSGWCDCVNANHTGPRCTDCVPGMFHHAGLETCETCRCPGAIVVCVPGMFHHAGMETCETCRCPAERSDGTCYVDEKSGQTMCNCVRNYRGPQCMSCTPGFYTQKGKCLPCHCWQNTHPNSTQICKSDTGICVDCFFNTTGDHCDKCIDGYTGAAANRTCVLNTASDQQATRDSAVHPQHHDDQSLGTGGVVTLCLLLGGVLVVGAALVIHYYTRYRSQHRPLPWSVQLHDEDINFSQMMEGQDLVDDPFGERLQTTEQRFISK